MERETQLIATQIGNRMALVLLTLTKLACQTTVTSYTVLIIQILLNLQRQILMKLTTISVIGLLGNLRYVAIQITFGTFKEDGKSIKLHKSLSGLSALAR